MTVTSRWAGHLKLDSLPGVMLALKTPGFTFGQASHTAPPKSQPGSVRLHDHSHLPPTSSAFVKSLLDHLTKAVQALGDFDESLNHS
jgi:hypothetical protein